MVFPTSITQVSDFDFEWHLQFIATVENNLSFLQIKQLIDRLRQLFFYRLCLKTFSDLRYTILLFLLHFLFHFFLDILFLVFREAFHVGI